MRYLKKKADLGFSLVELAVVLVIVTLLTSGLVITLSTQQDLRRIAETQRQLNDSKEAILGFAAANGRLPCPAKASIATGQTNAGKEDCTLTAGVLPWAELGLPETDAWGNRITYRTTQSFQDPIAPPTVQPPNTCTLIPTASSFALCSEGSLEIKDGAVMIAAKVPVVLLSHGPNGRGAFQSNGLQVGGASGHEEENSDNNNNFISHTPVSAGSPDEFDDIVSWIPLAILLNRMVTVNKLP